MNNEGNSASTLKNKRLNELDGRKWTKYSISVWQISKTAKEAKLKHPAMFPIELCSKLIDIYTKKGEVVLDPFMGSGSTLVAAKDKERKGIGFDINPKYVTLAKKRLSQQKLGHNFAPKKGEVVLDPFMGSGSTLVAAKDKERNREEKILLQRDLIQENFMESKVYCDDAHNILKHVKPETVDFVLTSPPYWNIHTRKRSADYKDSRPYSALENDIGNIENFNNFMNELKTIFEGVYQVLKHGKRCVVIVMDIRIGSQFIPFHINIIDVMKKVGFVFEDIIIWDRKQEYSNLRPLGYPYVFIVNKIHEYILIFRKNKEEVNNESRTV